MENVIETRNLTKIYGKQKAVDGLNLKVKKGEVHALVGPNGSGKTTFIRMLMGTTYPTSGDFSLFGVQDPKQISKERAKIGTLIELPKFFDLKTAYENLDFFCELRGIKDRKVINEVLDDVGLKDVGRKKVGKFSLGMKQRLGLAKALIHKPELLVLDEPINGLDPQGVVEIRNMIKLLHERGISIILASHILKELTMISTHYSMIKNGKIFDDFSAEEMGSRCGKWLEIETKEPKKAEELLKTYCKKIEIIEDKVNLFECSMESDQIMRLLITKGLSVLSCKESGNDLEDYFLKMINEN